MKINPISRRLVAFAVALVSSTLAWAQTATFETSSPNYSSFGGSATFDISFDYTGQSLSTMGVNIQLPNGWSFASSSGSNVPPIGPNAGTIGAAEFAYLSAPSNSLSYSVTLNYTSGLSGDQEIAGKILYKISGNSTELQAALGPVSIAEATLPSFDTQPQSTNVNEGSSANFSATVTSFPSPTLQWQKNGMNISGATNSTFVISPVSVADAGSYTLVATNSAGSATSSPAELTVTASPPVITSQPAARTVTEAGITSFIVTATGTGPLFYQWRKGGVDIPDQTSATLSLTNVQTTDADSYDVIISNVVGTVTSDAVDLTVQVPVAISTQPLSQTVVASTSVSFSVVATGDPAPTYQWRKDGSNLTGQTSSTLDLNNVDLAEAGDYDVVITNAVGSLTSQSATLAVRVPVTITTQPRSQTLSEGATLSLNVGADGFPAPTYQWRKEGILISGAAASSYTKMGVIETDAGTYDVVVSNVVGGVISSAAGLTVNVAPSITVQPKAKTIIEGANTSFSVTAIGTGPLSFQWRKGGGEISGQAAASLSLPNVQTADAGSYDVVISNVVGSVTSDAINLTVQVPESISTQPLSQTVVANTSVSFSVVATGDPAPTYQWRKDGTALTGLTASTLFFGDVDLADAGDYDVVVTNAFSIVTSNSATLSVQVPVSITTQPRSQTLDWGKTLTLSVEANGVPAPTYQWRKDGSAISGATANSYTKTDLVDADAGSYDVVLSNVVGDVTSDAANVSIKSMPVISAQPEGGVFHTGESFDLTVQASGASPLLYQWRKAGADVVGATSASLSFASLALDDAGAYDVGVTNPVGATTSQVAALTIVELAGTHSYAGKGYRTGKILTINNTITYAGDLATFGWSVIPPDAVSGQKWTFDGSGGSAGEVVPLSGDTDLFEWDWTSTPASPIEFSYTLNVPSNVNGDQNLAGVLRARASGTELDTMVNPDPLTVPVAPATHDADFDQDNKFSLSELLRVIELYNTREGTKRTGTYHPDGTSVDGFAPGPEPEE